MTMPWWQLGERCVLCAVMAAAVGHVSERAMKVKVQECGTPWSTCTEVALPTT